MLVLTEGSFSVFGEISQMTVNYKSDLAFGGFPSFLFSLYILSIYQGFSADAPPPPGPHGGGGGGPHGSGGPTPPGPTAAAVGGGPHGSGGPRPLGGRPRPLGGPMGSNGVQSGIDIFRW